MSDQLEEKVVLVDENDRGIGSMDKLSVHEKGLLHRAFSIFVFNTKGELLIQRRASDKYHSAGLWTNTCCSHPRPDEKIEEAAIRRLREEMGFSCNLSKAFHFIYKTDFENGLIEHEFDHVFVGFYDQNPIPNALEVWEWKYVNCTSLLMNLKNSPEQYTVWFLLSLEKVLAWKESNETFLQNKIISK